MVDSVHTSGAARLRPQSTQTQQVGNGPQASHHDNPVSAADSVALSDMASMQMAETLAAKGPPFDAARVNRIKQAVADGNYPVNPARIADVIFQDYSALMR